jgi:VanZ family protein
LASRSNARPISLKLLAATVAMVGVIVHGSLYPYDFVMRAGATGPVTALLDSWAAPPSSYGDLLANLLLYTPFGFFAALVLRAGGAAAHLMVGVVCGFLLSVSLELAQFYDVDRVTNMSDVYLNTSGAALGAVAALFVRKGASRPLPAGMAAAPVPLMLLVAMLGYHLFPYVPTIDLHKYWQSVKPLLVSPSLPPGTVLRYTALWLTTGWLLGEIVGFARSRLYLPVLIGLVFAGKVLIESLVLTLPEVVGGAAAVALWLIVGNGGRQTAMVVVAVLAGAVTAARLEPFHFVPAQQTFGWLPFGSFLAGSLSVNTMAFLEKFFLYGSLIWLLNRAGLRLRVATLSVVLLLFATSVVELYLPGRSAEITDAVMALMIGLVIALMRPAAESARGYSKPSTRFS